MYDYGEFVPGALRSSKDPHYRALGSRLDLYATYDEAIYAVVNGTHAYIESFSYNLILLFDAYKVGAMIDSFSNSNSGQHCLLDIVLEQFFFNVFANKKGVPLKVLYYHSLDAQQ